MPSFAGAWARGPPTSTQSCRALAGDPPSEKNEPGAPGESRIYRLFEAVGVLLESVSENAPVLLVADDIHWADDSTVALMRHVLERGTRRADPHPRDAANEAPARRELWPKRFRGSAREELRRRGLPGGLPESEVAELSQRLSDGELTDELVGAIARESAGNPFFVGELVRHLDESDEGAGVLSLTQAEVPERVREVVNLRLARLSEPALRLLSVAAVIGNEFDLSLLEDVGSSQGDEALAPAGGGLRPLSSSPSSSTTTATSFAFSHVLLRRTLLQRLPRASRRRVHARVAEALEADRGDEALLEIAHHMCEARNAADRERALDYRDARRRACHRRPRIRGGGGPLHPRPGSSPRGRYAPADARAQTRRRLPSALPRCLRRGGRRGSHRVLRASCLGGSDLDLVRRDVADDLVDTDHLVPTHRRRVLLEAFGARRRVHAEALDRPACVADDMAVLPRDVRETARTRSPSSERRPPGSRLRRPSRSRVRPQSEASVSLRSAGDHRAAWSQFPE